MVMKKIIRLSDVIIRCVEVFCEILLCVMIIVAAYCFVGRYFFNKSPQWGEPLATMCFVWVGLLSSSIALRRGIHIKIDMIEKLLPKKVNLFLDYLVYLGILFFAYYMVKAGYGEVQLTARNVMPSLHIKTSWLYAAFPVAGVFSIIAVAGRFLEDITEKKESRQ